jgi:hypothetical protein
MLLTARDAGRAENGSRQVVGVSAGPARPLRFDRVALAGRQASQRGKPERDGREAGTGAEAESGRPVL